MELYKNGFSKNEIAEMLGVNRSTVTRYFYSPTKAEMSEFYDKSAYGAYIMKDGTKIPFNRGYMPLDGSGWVEGYASQEWYYNDAMSWEHRIYNSNKRTVTYTA